MNLKLKKLIESERERSFGFTNATFDLHRRELDMLLDAAERSIELEEEVHKKDEFIEALKHQQTNVLKAWKEKTEKLEAESKILREALGELIGDIEKLAPFGDCPIPLGQLDKARDVLGKVK